MTRFSLALSLCLPLVVMACYETPKPKCAFHCGPDDLCPDGYTCASDGWCKRNDVGDDFDCDGTSIDASLADAEVGPDSPVIDAPPTPDTPPVPDAAPDAEPPDAAPDAEPPDAEPPDAEPPDAEPPDAFINSNPEIQVPGGAVQTCTAGEVADMTVTADDPDLFQDVVLSASWPSNRNPFAYGASFTPAAAGNPTSGDFDWTCGPLGIFDVNFHAEDDHTAAGTADYLVSFTVSPHPVVINEVRYFATAEQDIEIHNRDGSNSYSLTGWDLCIDLGPPLQCYTFPATTIPANGYIVVDWDATGLDNLVTEGTLVLYSSTTHTVDNIMDGVNWNVGAHTLLPDLVDSGHWPSEDVSAAIDVAGYVDGNSLAYSGSGEDKTSWSIDTSPTFGAANN